MYRKFVKRCIDILLSLSGLILASWLYVIIMIAIFIDDPGPVFFTQKRVGIHKKYFKLVKFRSMKMATPHDIPTHLLENPDQYITRVGKFLRKTSLDEIPQLWNILKGDMSVIGPRPALWNQEDLLKEREKYGANDVKPGLSGWAQICGRDELEIEDKARLDGEYVQKVSFLFDCRCFFGTAFHVLRRDGVVEGGTGELKREAMIADAEKQAPVENAVGSTGNTGNTPGDAAATVTVVLTVPTASQAAADIDENRTRREIMK
jgi:O-antigen biosynthesis protein WbqP